MQSRPSFALRKCPPAEAGCCLASARPDRVPILVITSERGLRPPLAPGQPAECAQHIAAAIPGSGVFAALPHATLERALWRLPSSGSLAVQSCSEVLVALCQVAQRVAVCVADDRRLSQVYPHLHSIPGDSFVKPR